MNEICFNDTLLCLLMPPIPCFTIAGAVHAANDWFAEVKDARRTASRSYYFNCLNSFGAAHCVAQCCRWKTAAVLANDHLEAVKVKRGQGLTFFNTVLFWALVIRILLLLLYPLCALVVVMSVRLALG